MPLSGFCCSTRALDEAECYVCIIATVQCQLWYWCSLYCGGTCANNSDSVSVHSSASPYSNQLRPSSSKWLTSFIAVPLLLFLSEHLPLLVLILLPYSFRSQIVWELEEEEEEGEFCRVETVACYFILLSFFFNKSTTSNRRRDAPSLFFPSDECIIL